MQLTITDITTEWGAYYDGVNRQNAIKWLATQMGSLLDHARAVYTAESEHRGALASGTRILQSAQCAWTPLGGVTLSPTAIKKYAFKVDFETCPHAYLYDSWVGFLRGGNLDPVEWPFVRWIVEAYILPQMKEDLKANELWSGVAAAVTPGTASTAGTTMNGMAKVIADTLTAGYSTAITTGALATDPKLFVAQIEDFVASIPPALRKGLKTLKVDPNLELRYRQGYQEKYGTVINFDRNDPFGSNTVRNFNDVRLVGVEEMEGSNRVWGTTEGNFVKVYDAKEFKTEESSEFKIESSKRTISIWNDFRLGLGLEDPRLLFANELV
jgi:hypothetical protein